MSELASTNALERLLRPMSRDLTRDLARALVNVHADAETQTRYDELADKRSIGQLTAAERAELQSMVRANTLLGLLKVQARALLDRGTTS